MASVIVVVIVTGSSVATRLRVAFVDLVLTISSGKAYLTGTVVTIDPVHASATIHAGTFRTIFIISLAVHPAEAQLTGTGIRVHVLRTGCSILTRHRETLVNVHLAVFSLESIHT